MLTGDAGWQGRIRAVRANASAKSHAELDASDRLDAGDPHERGRHYGRLKARMPNLTVLGGCSGTDHRHVTAICRSVVPACRMAAAA